VFSDTFIEGQRSNQTKTCAALFITCTYILVAGTKQEQSACNNPCKNLMQRNDETNAQKLLGETNTQLSGSC
jgi:hypothetical protein